MVEFERTPSLTVNSTSYVPGVLNICTGSAMVSVGVPSLKSHKYPVTPVSSVELLPVKFTVKGASPEVISASNTATGT